MRSILVAIAVCAVLPLGAASASAQDAAPEATPTMTVTPNANLVDHQIVTVTGTGFRGHRFVDVMQCEAGSQDLGGCVVPGLDFATPGSTGTFTVSGGLDAVIRPFGGQAVDCRTAPGACEIVAFGTDDAIASTPLSFDPSAPLADPPTLTVTPNTGLVDGQVVQVDAAGFRPGSVLFLFVCEGDVPTSRRCPNSYSATDDTRVDDTGAMSAPYRVRAVIDVEGGASVDCRVAHCFLSASPTPWEEDLPMVPLEFDPDAPLLPDPTITATPSTGLVDGQLVTVSGSGWFAGDLIELLQCATGAGMLRCSDDFGHLHVADGRGRFEGTLRVHRTFDASGAVDCLEVACSAVAIRVDQIGSDPQLAVAALSFAAQPAPPAAVPSAVEPRFTG